MTRLFTSVFYILIIIMTGCTTEEKSVGYGITNPSDQSRSEVIKIDVSDQKLPLKGYGLKVGSKVIPGELIDINGDGTGGELYIFLNFEPNETLKGGLVPTEASPKKLTQAELSIKTGGEWEGRKYKGGTFENVDFLEVPEEHTDHSYFIRYEGPGWESDKAAYRFYLDWRNGVDYFGKLGDDPVLQGVGLDGFDSYHELGDWGMDLLKVGQTLGLGSIGRYVNDTLYRFRNVDSVSCEIKMNGSLKSAIETNYYNWKTGNVSTTLNSVMSIGAGSAVSAHQLTFTNPIPDFCTGLVINEGEESIDKKMGEYRVLASYGDFSLNQDQMGLAIIVKNSDVASVSEGAGSRVVKFTPKKEITYYLLAVWEQGKSAVKSKMEFESLLDQELVKLNEPITVTKQ
ncbi:MAG: DUF4861 family protein [Marinoscillum sp.]